MPRAMSGLSFIIQTFLYSFFKSHHPAESLGYTVVSNRGGNLALGRTDLYKVSRFIP